MAQQKQAKPDRTALERLLSGFNYNLKAPRGDIELEADRPTPLDSTRLSGYDSEAEKFPTGATPRIALDQSRYPQGLADVTGQSASRSFEPDAPVRTSNSSTNADIDTSGQGKLERILGMKQRAPESLATLKSSYQQDPSIELAGLRSTRERELKERTANDPRDARSSALLKMLQGEQDDDPVTGIAERGRVQKIRDSQAATNEFNRPDVYEMREDNRKFDLAKEGESERVTGLAQRDVAGINAGANVRGHEIDAKAQVEAATANATGKGKGASLASGLVERIGNAKAALSMLRGLREQYAKGGKGFIGPAAGRMGSLRQQLPGISQDPAFDRFMGDTSIMTTAAIKAATGAQSSDTERANIMKGIPDVNTPEGTWLQKADAMEDNITDLLENFGNLLNRPDVKDSDADGYVWGSNSAARRAAREAAAGAITDPNWGR